MGLPPGKSEKVVSASTGDALIETDAIGALARAESLSGLLMRDTQFWFADDAAA
jgi:hypothetical protein